MTNHRKIGHVIESTALALAHPKIAFLCLAHDHRLRPVLAIQRLVRMGLFEGITHLIDAGAHEGDYTHDALAVLPNIKALCFEPAPATFSRLKKRLSRRAGVELFPVALGAANGNAKINLSPLDRASSLLPTAKAHVDAWPESFSSQTAEVSVATLDSYLNNRSSTEKYFLKADVQGFELELLKGSLQSLDRIRAVQLEVSFVPLFEGAPSLIQVLAFMEEHGFVVCDTSEVIPSPSTGIPLQADFVFYRR